MVGMDMGPFLCSTTLYESNLQITRYYTIPLWAMYRLLIYVHVPYCTHIPDHKNSSALDIEKEWI